MLTIIPAVLKMIFIAGNEPFTQGKIDYKDAAAEAKEKDIVVNTIFCGDYNHGIQKTRPLLLPAKENAPRSKFLL